MDVLLLSFVSWKNFIEINTYDIIFIDNLATYFRQRVSHVHSTYFEMTVTEVWHKSDFYGQGPLLLTLINFNPNKET